MSSCQQDAKSQLHVPFTCLSAPAQGPASGSWLLPPPSHGPSGFIFHTPRAALALFPHSHLILTTGAATVPILQRKR